MSSKPTVKLKPAALKWSLCYLLISKGFTKISEQLSAEDIVSGIDEYFEVFDLIVEKYGIEKIKTIGDAYLCVSGMPIADPEHASHMIRVAEDFIKAVAQLKEKTNQRK